MALLSNMEKTSVHYKGQFFTNFYRKFNTMYILNDYDTTIPFVEITVITDSAIWDRIKQTREDTNSLFFILNRCFND